MVAHGPTHIPVTPMLRVLGFLDLVLSPIVAAIGFFQDLFTGDEALFWALSGLVSGAVLIGLGSIQEDVRALRNQLVPSAEPAVPSDAASTVRPAPHVAHHCQACGLLNDPGAKRCLKCKEPLEVA